MICRTLIRYARRFVAPALLATLASGCASCAESAERDRIRDDRTEDHVYLQPCETVLASAQVILFERGFSISLAEPTALTLATEWRDGGVRREVERSHYLVSGVEARPETCAISARLQEQTFDDFDEVEELETRRDLDFEWDLLRLADPAAAAEIQAEIDAV